MSATRYTRLLACLVLSLVAPAAMAKVSTSRVDGTGNSGASSSIQLDGGNPVIAYTRDGSIMLATCTADCATAPTWVIVPVGVGTMPTLQLNAGNPVVSYIDNNAVKLATCTAGCATATPTWVTSTVQPTGVFSQALALAGGNPVVVYVDSTLQELYLATCTANCSTATPTWARSLIAKKQPGDMYFLQQASVVIDGGTPWVSYERGFIGGSDLTVATCTADCASATATWVRSTVDQPLQGHTLYVSNGVPSVGYYSFPQLNQDLKYAVCTAACGTASATWVSSVVEVGGNTGRGASLQYWDGLPVITFIDGSSKLKVARCTANCTAASPTWSFETVDQASEQTSLVISGAVARATYYDFINLDLRLAMIPSDAPVLQVSHLSMDFAVQSMGTTSAPQTVFLTNTGELQTLTIGNVIGTGPVIVDNTCTNIAPLESCAMSVSFHGQPNPGAAVNSVTPAAGTVSIPSNAVDSPREFPVTGSVEKSLVSHYYRSILFRPPDAGGRDFWRNETTRVTALGANVNEVWFAMAQSFFASAEYLALNRDNPGFVSDLYRTFFNREPDQAGLDFWVGQRVAGLPREVMLAAFMFSPEFTGFTQAIFGNTAARAEVDVVLDFYRGLLSRLPDDSGFNFWIGRFRAAQCSGQAAVISESEAISKAFVDSGEYAARARNNAQFVGDLYNAFLRRGGDLNGVQFWVDQLATGARTRDQVRAEFKNSAEFQARVNAVIAQGCMN